MSRPVRYVPILELAEDICERSGSAVYRSIYWTDSSGVLQMVRKFRINLAKGTKNGPRRSESLAFVTVKGLCFALESGEWKCKGMSFRTIPMRTLEKVCFNDSETLVPLR